MDGWYYVIYNKYGFEEITANVNFKASKIIRGNNYHFFTEQKEAKKFADKYFKKHQNELERIQEEVKKYTVTRAQIAEKFDIPLDKLVITEY